MLDTGNNASLGSGGTHFENAFTSVNNLISSVGTGSSTSNTLPYVFLITDGSQDCQTQWNGSWSGNNSGCSPYYNSSTTIDTSNCTTLKNRGITIAVLYIPYQTIQNPTTFSNSEDIYANSNIPNIPGALQSCASPQLLLYGEHADGHHQRTDRDVRASGEHRSRYQLTREFDLKGCACALSPASASWDPLQTKRGRPKPVPPQRPLDFYLNSSPALPGGRVSSC